MGAFHKVLIVLAIGSFAAILGLAAVGNVLQSRGVQNTPAISTAFKLTAFSLFLVLAYTLVALLLHVFIVAQDRIGNGNVGMVVFLRTHEIGVDIGVWSMFTLGLLIALPVLWTQFFSFSGPAGGPSGNIVSNVGLTLADTASRSSYRLSSSGGTSINQGIFSFELADAGVRFTNCTYCALETAARGGGIIHIKCDISLQPMPPNQLEVERNTIIGQLQAAGWSAGYVDAADLERAKRHPSDKNDTRFWAKDSALLILSDRRTDDEKPGEDPATAGLYIHYIDVVPRNDSAYKTLVFDSDATAVKSSIAN